MRKVQGNKTASIILGVIISLIAIALIFCVVVLVYGACTDMTFLQVLEYWFAGVKVPTVEEVETATQAAHLIGM